ncbi:MAG: type II toxin-antitoxin system HicB family antitoxin [Candidatus Atribacteria bacterium]|nr:type II toxin-antitoxin system HicB family antitoxin [Candidatus Atribacteria bacterium]
MLIEYIEEALNRAHYEIIDDEEPFYGEVKELPGVWASGSTLEECRRNLRETIEGWILLSIKKELPIPNLGNKSIDFVSESIINS